jgi:hypothetical protein
MRTALTEFVDYYNNGRPHRSLACRHPFRSLRPSTAGSLPDRSWADSVMPTTEQLEPD